MKTYQIVNIQKLIKIIRYGLDDYIDIGDGCWIYVGDNFEMLMNDSVHHSYGSSVIFLTI